ncbi:hypothetical protein BDR04DRAFT_1082096, partial [Suillus decipiens]
MRNILRLPMTLQQMRMMMTSANTHLVPCLALLVPYLSDTTSYGTRLSLRPSNINCGRTCLLTGSAAPSLYSQPTCTIKNSRLSLPWSLGQK